MSITRCAWPLIVWLAACGVCAGEPVVTIRSNGQNANRLNVVFMGDGYSAAEMVKFATDVDILVASMFTQQPYTAYEPYFNIHRVDVVSKESGASHPERSVKRDTALGAAYNCGGVQRLICVDNAAVAAVLSRSVPASEQDLVIIVVNDAEYGGAGGRYSIASKHPLVVELMLHEAGHTLALLSDEYVDGGPCSGASEPSAVNATRETGRDRLKWSHWVDERTPLPSITSLAAVPGLYAGGNHCPELYRPTYDSKMRSLSRPFEQINTEQLIKRFYNIVSPIDAVLPAKPDVTLSQGDPFSFSVERPRPVGFDLLVNWTIDDRPAGTDDSLAFDARRFAPGRHTVEVTVRDPNPAVRSDPREALVERFRWTVTIVP